MTDLLFGCLPLPQRQLCQKPFCHHATYMQGIAAGSFDLQGSHGAPLLCTCAAMKLHTAAVSEELLSPAEMSAEGFVGQAPQSDWPCKATQRLPVPALRVIHCGA